MAAPEMPACETPHPKFGQALSTVEPSSAVLQANCGIMGYWDFIRHPRCLFFRFRRSHLIPRYTRPEMGHVWSDANRFAKWLEVEIAAAETLAEAGQVPKEAAVAIRTRAKVDVARIHELEARVPFDRIEIRQIPSVRERIEHNNVMPQFHAQPRKARPNKSGSAGDE